MEIKAKKSTIEKVQQILRALEGGAARDELAFELGYTNPKSLDVFMRRNGFLYLKDKKAYIPAVSASEHEPSQFAEEKKAEYIVLNLMDQEADLKAVAARNGFENTSSMAEFMKNIGYIWDEAISNYQLERSPSDKAALDSLQTRHTLYELFLHRLYESRDILFQMLEAYQANKSRSTPSQSLTIELSQQQYNYLIQIAAERATDIQTAIGQLIEQAEVLE